MFKDDNFMFLLVRCAVHLNIIPSDSHSASLQNASSFELEQEKKLHLNKSVIETEVKGVLSQAMLSQNLKKMFHNCIFE